MSVLVAVTDSKEGVGPRRRGPRGQQLGTDLVVVNLMSRSLDTSDLARRPGARGRQRARHGRRRPGRGRPRGPAEPPRGDPAGRRPRAGAARSARPSSAASPSACCWNPPSPCSRSRPPTPDAGGECALPHRGPGPGVPQGALGKRRCHSSSNTGPIRPTRARAGLDRHGDDRARMTHPFGADPDEVVVVAQSCSCRLMSMFHCRRSVRCWSPSYSITGRQARSSRSTRPTGRPSTTTTG